MNCFKHRIWLPLQLEVNNQVARGSSLPICHDLPPLTKSYPGHQGLPDRSVIYSLSRQIHLTGIHCQIYYSCVHILHLCRWGLLFLRSKSDQHWRASVLPSSALSFWWLCPKFNHLCFILVFHFNSPTHFTQFWWFTRAYFHLNYYFTKKSLHGYHWCQKQCLSSNSMQVYTDQFPRCRLSDLSL